MVFDTTGARRYRCLSEFEVVLGWHEAATDLPGRDGVRLLAEATFERPRLRPWVDSSVDPVGALSRACLAVKPPGPGICRVCCGPSDEARDLCTSCTKVERGVDRPLHPVTPISLTTRATGLYAALKQYKGRPNHLAFRQRNRLAELIGSFLEAHRTCVAPDGYDTAVVVPSLGLGAASHPLGSTLRMAGLEGRGLADALFVGPGRLDRNVADRCAYVCRRELVEGRRVLLVDDTYTTGAHLHSAAAALEEADARSVHLLVVGRHQRSEWAPGRAQIRWAALRENVWTPNVCVRCRRGLAL